MFLTRIFGRTLYAAAKSELSAAAAAASSKVPHNPLEEFFEADRNPEDDKPVVYDFLRKSYTFLLECFCRFYLTDGSWKASELRLKSWDDLHKLRYVLLKEKNMLMTQRQMLHAQNLRFLNPERIPKVRKSMCRIKHVLTERTLDEPDARRSAEMRRMINALKLFTSLLGMVEAGWVAFFLVLLFGSHRLQILNFTDQIFFVLLCGSWSNLSIFLRQLVLSLWPLCLELGSVGSTGFRTIADTLSCCTNFML